MNTPLKIDAVVGDLQRAFQIAWAEFSDLATSIMSSSGGASYYDEELKGSIVSIYIRLQFAFELLGLATLLGELRSGFEEYRKDLTAVDITAFGHPTSPTLDYLYRYFHPLKISVTGVVGGDISEGVQQLERILLGTPKLIHDRKLQPKRELDVSGAMYQLLIHPYPDAVRDVPIAKQSKTYKPDIGIPSLKTAIEYKFVTSEKTLKSALGGIYEDVSGYAGSQDWKTFFVVIYMTELFLTQAQVEAEFKMSVSSGAWKPLLVVGKAAPSGRGA